MGKDQIKNDINRMQTLCPGLVTGGRFGGFAVPLGAILFAQEVMWYLTRFQKAPKKASRLVGGARLFNGVFPLLLVLRCASRVALHRVARTAKSRAKTES